MTEENKPEGKIDRITGITAWGNLTIGNVSGQIAVGENINQIQTINQTDFKELRGNLREFQKGIDKLGLEPEDHDIVSANINSVIKEAEKEEPQQSKIKELFESAIKTIKEAGKTITNVSELYEPAKKIAKLFGIALTFL